MGGGKLPPRQKMIGLMYLVLMALLALNVAKSILDIFANLNKSISKTSGSFVKKNEFIYNEFARQNGSNPEKVGPYYKLAMQVKDESDKLAQHISDLKAHLINEIDELGNIDTARAIGKDIIRITNKDNYDKPMHILIGDDIGSPRDGEWSGVELMGKIDAYRKLLLNIASSEPIKLKEDQLKVFENKIIEDVKAFKHTEPDGVTYDWVGYNFDHAALVAAATILTKIELDVRNTEGEALTMLYEGVNGDAIPFNKIEALLMPTAGDYVIRGNSYTADIFIAASDSTSDPIVLLSKRGKAPFYETETLNNGSARKNDGTLDYDKLMGGSLGNAYDTLPIKGGNGKMDVRASSTGDKEYGGLVILKTASGDRAYPFNGKYTVAEANVTVSATKMNVFYKGVDNPVSISVPGANNVKATASQGNLVRKGKDWIMQIRDGNTTTIKVQAEQPDGSYKGVGAGVEFRVKRIPDPKATVAGKSGSATISQAQLKATGTVKAEMENFDFDLDVKVKSFVFSTTVSGGTLVEEKVNGDRLNDAVQNLIANAKKNSKVYFEKIMVKMPDGSTRELAPVILKIL